MMIFAFVKDICFNFAFSAVAKFGGGCPLVVVEKLTIGFQADHVILVKVIQFQKHLIIIIASIHGKRCFSKEVGSPFYGLKSNRIGRFIIFFLRRMDLRKNANRMIDASKNTGFRYMIAFFINIFRGSTFRAIPDNSESFQFIAGRLNNITIIDVNYGVIRHPFFNLLQIGGNRR